MLRLRYTIFVAALFLALLLSATNTVSASADEVVPPAEETTSTELPPMEGETEEATSAEEEVAEEGSDPGADSEQDPSTEEEVAEEGSDPDADSEQDPSTEPLLEQLPSDPEQTPSTEPLIEQLPENTELVVLDENGEPLPLASQEASEILAVSDPQWCPVGVIPGSATCSGVKTSFNGGNQVNNLIEWLKQNQPAKAGVIWIEASYNSTTAGEGGPVILDGLELTSMGNFALTINGGWTGTGIILNANTPSTFEVPFSIINWNAAVTINNIVVQDASGTGPALEVITTQAIIMNNVDVLNNTTDGGGARLETTSALGKVAVNESNFNGNTQGSGLKIESKGAVTLKNIGAIGNYQYGASIDNSAAASAVAVTLNGFNNFSYNGLDGLKILSRGAVTLNNIASVYNAEGSGAYIDNDYGYLSAVTFSGMNTFNNNGWDGLRIYSKGIVVLNNVTANSNGTDPSRPAATEIDPDSIPASGDEYYDGDAYGKGLAVFNWSTLPKAVSLTGTNMFNNNAGTGLYIDSNGLVKVSNLTANYNACNPAYDIDPAVCAGAYISGGGVTQTGYGTFIGNVAQGLEVYNAYVPSVGGNVGSISLSTLYATDNEEGGVLVMNSGKTPYNVSIKGLKNVFSNNLNGDGLQVTSNGVVTLSNVTANTNDGFGVRVDNTSAKSSKGVTISGSNIFNDNSGRGLSVSSNGSITTNNVTAIYNFGYGVFLDNCGWDSFLSDCTGLRPDGGVMAVQAVSMNGINNTSWNDGTGIWIVSLGTIKLNNLDSNWSTELGGYFYNAFNPAVDAGVTQTGYANFLNNLGSGFEIYSTGLVSLANVTANGNQTYGGLIHNYERLSNVLLSGVNVFNENGTSGLWVQSLGAVTLKNVTANWNGYGGTWTTDVPPVFVPYPGPHYGVEVSNAGGTSPRGVLITGINTFNYNNGAGLWVESKGGIKVYKVTAVSNQEHGAYLFNDDSTINAAISLLGYGIFTNNVGSGLGMVGNGNIIAYNVTATDNGDDGAYLFNDSVTTIPSSVSLLGISAFNNNLGDGLLVFTDGAITLNSISAGNNTGWGAYLNNANLGTTSARRNLVVNGTNLFSGNLGGGLYFNLTGSAILNRVTAAMNNDNLAGAPLSDGIYGDAGGSITLNCVFAFMNEGNDYSLNAAGTITLNSVYTYGGSTYTNGAAVVKTRACKLP